MRVVVLLALLGAGEVLTIGDVKPTIGVNLLTAVSGSVDAGLPVCDSLIFPTQPTAGSGWGYVNYFPSYGPDNGWDGGLEYVVADGPGLPGAVCKDAEQSPPVDIACGQATTSMRVTLDGLSTAYALLVGPDTYAPVNARVSYWMKQFSFPDGGPVPVSYMTRWENGGGNHELRRNDTNSNTYWAFHHFETGDPYTYGHGSLEFGQVYPGMSYLPPPLDPMLITEVNIRAADGGRGELDSCTR